MSTQARGSCTYRVEHNRYAQLVGTFTRAHHCLYLLRGQRTNVEDQCLSQFDHLLNIFERVCHHWGGTNGKRNIGCIVHDNHIRNVMDEGPLLVNATQQWSQQWHRCRLLVIAHVYLSFWGLTVVRYLFSLLPLPEMPNWAMSTS